jgi:hypothetical protein
LLVDLPLYQTKVATSDDEVEGQVIGMGTIAQAPAAGEGYI